MPPNTQPPMQSNNPLPNMSGPQRIPGSKEGYGPIIATIIILAVIVLGGLYFWGQHKSASTSVMPDDSAQSSLNVSAIESVSKSDDPTSLETDLNNTNTNIDTELQAS